MKEKTGFKKSTVSRRSTMKRTILIFCALLVPLYFASVASAEVLTSISGRVIAEDTGEGLSGINVQANPRSYHTITDENGFYILNDVKPGSYVLFFFTTEDSESMYISEFPLSASDIGAKVVEVPIGKHATNVNHIMKLGGGITGRIMDEHGSPIKDADVSVYVPGQPSSILDTKGARTDAEGNYKITGLPEVDYGLVTVTVLGHAKVRKAAPIVKGQITEDVDFTISMSDPTGISGTILIGATQSPGADITISVSDKTGLQAGLTITDGEGKYSIVGLEPGTYTIRISSIEPDIEIIYKENIIVEQEKLIEVNFEFNEPEAEVKPEAPVPTEVEEKPGIK